MRKKRVRAGDERGTREFGRCERQKTDRKYKREGDGDVMLCSSSSGSVFVQILSINCRSTLRIKNSHYRVVRPTFT